MSSHNRDRRPLPTGPRIAERLLACARLCRQIAEATENKDMAQDFGRLADDCTRMAVEIDPFAGSHST